MAVVTTLRKKRAAVAQWGEWVQGLLDKEGR